MAFVETDPFCSVPFPLRLRFDTAWEGVARDGLCDSYGGVEYRRLANEWARSDCPLPARPWIVANANRSARD